jgi:hypothetical protein
MTKEIPDHGEEFRGEPGAGDEGKDDSAGIHHDRGVRANTQYHPRGRFIATWIFKNKTRGWRCRLGDPAATVRFAIFPLRLLLFYIVYNGVNRGASVLSQQSLLRKKRKTVLQAMRIGIGLLSQLLCL